MPAMKMLPKQGRKITIVREGQLLVPDDPIIPFIEGDGTGVDIWAAAVRVFDAAVQKAYAGKRHVVWLELLAGEKAFKQTGNWLPEDTCTAIAEHKVAIKGPLTTPVGGGIRSLNVALRQLLDLYACVRPVRYYQGVPSPVKNPGSLDLVIFRENTEDVYAGHEWKAGCKEAKAVIAFLNKKFKKSIRLDSGIGVKPISKFCSQRLIRRAIRYALAKGRKTVTLVHKGNIMKFTEGAFRDWGYELARKEFKDQVISEEALWKEHGGKLPQGKILLNDRIADSMFQQLLLRPAEYSVLATPNLNGDYLSDAAAAQVGGLGMAPGANCGAKVAIFEATHGTAPKYAGLDKVNPCSVILSGCMLFEHLGWDEVSRLIQGGIEKSVAAGTVTYDLARGMPNARELTCSAFGQAIIANL